MLRGILGLAGAAAALVVSGTLLFVPQVGGGGGPPNPQVTAILNAIDANLANLGGSLTASLAANDSRSGESFVGGALYAKGASQLRMERTFASYIHNSTEFNVIEPGDNGAANGLQWNDPTGTAVAVAANRVGFVDPRAVLNLGRTLQNELAMGAPETVNGVLANKLFSSSLAIYVDATHPSRVLRAAYTNGGSVNQADFGNWSVCGAGGGELPTFWLATNWSVADGVPYRQIAYTLSNVATGVPIADSMFQTAGVPWIPGQ